MKDIKIALGTAQFGMDYGINNPKGKVNKEEIFEILNEAFKSGIDILDTAHDYGKSESVIGKFIRENKKDFKIVSKLPNCNPEEVITIFDSSLKRLVVDKLYGYLIHSFQSYREYPEIWDIIENLKAKGKVEKIGFSLYFPRELDYILDNKINIDLIQVPYSIFDQRFEPYFSKLKKNAVEIHVRSVFLQGLFFKKPEELDDYFVKVKEKIENINSLAAGEKIPLVALCVNFAVINKFIDKVVVGVDSIDNLKEIVSSSNHLRDVKHIQTDLFHFREEDEKMILPFNWKVEAA